MHAVWAALYVPIRAQNRSNTSFRIYQVLASQLFHGVLNIGRMLNMCCVGDAADAAVGGPKAASWRDLPVEKRLAHALVKGIDEFAVRVRSSGFLWVPVGSYNPSFIATGLRCVTVASSSLLLMIS